MNTNPQQATSLRTIPRFAVGVVAEHAPIVDYPLIGIGPDRLAFASFTTPDKAAKFGSEF